MSKNQPSDVFDPPDPKKFDGPALARWMEVWRISSADLAARLGITTQTLYNWRLSDEPLKAWVPLALAAIEHDEEEKRAEARASGGS